MVGNLCDGDLRLEHRATAGGSPAARWCGSAQHRRPTPAEESMPPPGRPRGPRCRDQPVSRPAVRTSAAMDLAGSLLAAAVRDVPVVASAPCRDGAPAASTVAPPARQDDPPTRLGRVERQRPPLIDPACTLCNESSRRRWAELSTRRPRRDRGSRRRTAHRPRSRPGRRAASTAASTRHRPGTAAADRCGSRPGTGSGRPRPRPGRCGNASVACGRRSRAARPSRRRGRAATGTGPSTSDAPTRRGSRVAPVRPAGPTVP